LKKGNPKLRGVVLEAAERGSRGRSYDLSVEKRKAGDERRRTPGPENGEATFKKRSKHRGRTERICARNFERKPVDEGLEGRGTIKKRENQSAV